MSDRASAVVTLHQFTQPIHDTPIGPALVLPPRWSDGVAYAASLEGVEQWTPAVGGEAEVVETWRTPYGDKWARVAFVRVRRVLTIYDPDTLVDVGLPDEWMPHVTVEPTRCSAWFPNNPYRPGDWDDYTLDLPTAEPGGLVVVVERIDCPDCGGRRELCCDGDSPMCPPCQSSPCPTCTTPPEVTT
jgi:hypothetical protein